MKIGTESEKNDLLSALVDPMADAEPTTYSVEDPAIIPPPFLTDNATHTNTIPQDMIDRFAKGVTTMKDPSSHTDRDKEINEALSNATHLGQN